MFSDVHEIQEALTHTKACLHNVSAPTTRLHSGFAAGARTQWRQPPASLKAFAESVTAYLRFTTETLVHASTCLYDIELTCFPHGVNLPYLSEAEVAASSLARSVSAREKAWLRALPSILAACESVPVKLPVGARKVLNDTASWFDMAEPKLHEVTTLTCSVPVHEFAMTLQRVLTPTEAGDATAALATNLEKIPEPLRTLTRDMNPMAMPEPTTATALWIRDFRIQADGDPEWINENVHDGVVTAGYVLAVKTKLWKRHPKAIALMGSYLLAEKKYGSGWSRLTSDRLFPWPKPIVAGVYTYWCLLPCDAPGKFRVRAKSWSLT